jgi:hypothetical protein
MPRGRPRRVVTVGEELGVAQKVTQQVSQAPQQQITQIMIPPKFVGKLAELDEIYRQKKSTCRNIIDDARITPSNRFYKFVREAVRNGYDSERAAEYAIRRLETRRDFIAGNCGRVEWDKML